MNTQQQKITLAVLLALSSMPIMAEEKKAIETEAEALPEVAVQQKRIKQATPNDAVYSRSKTETPIRDIPASV